MKAFITNYEEYCLLCGSPDATDTHHLIFGRYEQTETKQTRTVFTFRYVELAIH
jgi:hypothetical protein